MPDRIRDLIERVSSGQIRSRMVNGRSNTDVYDQLSCPEDMNYSPCPEAYPREGVSAGEIITLTDWTEEEHYPGCKRDIAIYVSKGIERSSPARVIIFNDGSMYLDPEGPVRAVTVLDNLVANGEIEPTVAVFIQPGLPENPETESDIWEETPSFTQRSLEYDTMSPAYAEFLVSSVLPTVEEATGIRLSKKPHDRTICGISSGGIAAFTVAWEMPEQFGNVLSHCGSFVNIRGGHNYPYLVRNEERKPIRIFLQGGANDARIPFGDLPLANKLMAASLDFAGYDMRFEFGEGAHSLCHGGALFAESLRWLWR